LGEKIQGKHDVKKKGIFKGILPHQLADVKALMGDEADTLL
jgi:5'-3' exonuclease